MISEVVDLVASVVGADRFAQRSPASVPSNGYESVDRGKVSRDTKQILPTVCCKSVILDVRLSRQLLKIYMYERATGRRRNV